MNFKKMTKRFCLSLVVVLVALALVGCKDPEGEDMYTYNTYTAQSPSNWNELTYQDANDTQIMGYIADSFFSYNFKYDENGEIVPGEFVMEYAAATKLEDVTAEYAGEDKGWGIAEGAVNQAYTITLREDLKWDDGTPIKAEDFVYTIKELLNPDFQNYRADTVYVGATIIHNAENYVKQGQMILTDNCTDPDAPATKYTVADLVKGEDGVYTLPDGKAVFFALKTALAWCGGKTVEYYSSYLDAASYEALLAKADSKGNVQVTDETIALVTTLINTDNWGNEDATHVPLYMVYESGEYATVDFSEVGCFVGDTEYEIVLVLDKALPLLKEDGSLSYQAAYNMASLPLVHKAKYEANKVEPTTANALWTSTYNSSVESTASWGPYKLESFQAGKSYVLVRNEHWYGYNDEAFEGQYQTDRIVCETIGEWATAWQKFQGGEIDGIGIDVTIADEYKNSERAYFTPSDYVASLQLQSSKAALAERQEEGYNKTILSYVEFRNALSLAINRADFAAKTTTASFAGFGLFNSMHYYDVENGGVYRNSDDAKKVLCEVYGVNPDNYDSLDAAVDAVTGYDLTAAKALVTEAYNKALAAGDIKATDIVKLTLGTGVINETVTRRFNYIQNAWLELVKGTPLEDRLEFEVQDFSTAWADDFMAGGYDVCMGGWQGAAWDPGYFLMAYIHPGVAFSAAWDTTQVMLEFTMKGVGENGEDITDTMSLMDWYWCLNGATGAKYDFSANALEQTQRLQLIAALEKEVLKAYYSVPLYNNFSASLLSYKVDYTTYEYNTFMGYGGLRYMTYNYTDAEWAEVIEENNGEINYK